MSPIWLQFLFIHLMATMAFRRGSAAVRQRFLFGAFNRNGMCARKYFCFPPVLSSCQVTPCVEGTTCCPFLHFSAWSCCIQSAATNTSATTATSIQAGGAVPTRVTPTLLDQGTVTTSPATTITTTMTPPTAPVVVLAPPGAPGAGAPPVAPVVILAPPGAPGAGAPPVAPVVVLAPPVAALPAPPVPAVPEAPAPTAPEGPPVVLTAPETPAVLPASAPAVAPAIDLTSEEETE